MANLSSAFGTVVITAPNKQLLFDLLYLHITSETGMTTYDTTLTDIEPFDIEQVTKYVEQYAIQSEENPDATSIKLDFSGTGRWNFRNNIDWFFDILKPTKGDTPETAELRNHLAKHVFTTEWDVIDSESGANFIHLYEVTTEWDPNTKQTVVKMESDTNNQDYTASNLIAHGIYDQGEVWDVEYILAHFDEAIDYIRQEATGDDDEYDQLIDHIMHHQDAFRHYLEASNNDDVEYELYTFLVETLGLSTNSF